MLTRSAAVADAAGIATVHVRSWQAAYAGLLDPQFLAGLSVEQRARGWASALESGACHVRVAQRGDLVVAFVSYGRCRNEGAPGSRGEIWALYALPDTWGQGAGRQLTGEALDDLRAAGYASCSLWVLADNRRAIGFYEAAGFAEVGGSRKTFELGGRQVDEIEFLLELSRLDRR